VLLKMELVGVMKRNTRNVKLKTVMAITTVLALSGCFSSSDKDTGDAGLPASLPDNPDELVNTNSALTLSSHLTQLRSDFLSGGTQNVDKRNTPANIVDEGVVLLTITTSSTETSLVRARLENLGMINVSQYKHLISGAFPIKDLDKLGAVQGISWVNSTKATRRDSSGGIAYNVADVALFTDVIKKQENVDGTGVKIGVMSDSFDCLGGARDDILSGDLPNITVIKEYSYCFSNPQADEGRAMLQLIHDIAPGAELLFYTAFESQADFALGIQELANAGADIIVDDIGWLNMPMFQEGPIAQSVTEVEARGVVYFSAAGNNARLSYEKAYKPTQLASGTDAHDFGLAAGGASDVYQKITVPANVDLTIVLQWDDPSEVSGGPTAGAQTDLDLILLDSDMNNIIATGKDVNKGHDPVEIITVSSTNFGDGVAEGNLLIRKSAGPDPKYVKYVIFSSAPAEVLGQQSLPIVERIKLNDNGELIKEGGEPVTAGQAVIIMPNGCIVCGGNWLPGGDLYKVGAGGSAITEKPSTQTYGIFLDATTFVEIDTVELPIFLIPEGFIALLADDNTTIDLIRDPDAEQEQQVDVRIAEYATKSSTSYGHPNAAGAIAVGAMAYKQTPWFPQGAQRIEPFSSAGGTPIFFDKDGARLSAAEYRAKPEIVSVDDVDTTFFGADNLTATDSDLNGFPNFKGTSAAAPNAAAVAALLLQKYPHLLPSQVKILMMTGTVDLSDPAGASSNDANLPAVNPCSSGVTFDWGTGCGLIQAHKIFATAASNPALVADIQEPVVEVPDNTGGSTTGETDTTDTGTTTGGSSPTDVPTILVGDYNNNGCFDEQDKAMLLLAIRSGLSASTYDLSGDGTVNGDDVTIMDSLLTSADSCL